MRFGDYNYEYYNTNALRLRLIQNNLLLMICDEVIKPLLHLLGRLREPLLVQRVHQHNVVVDQGRPDGGAENKF